MILIYSHSTFVHHATLDLYPSASRGISFISKLIVLEISKHIKRFVKITQTSYKSGKKGHRSHIHTSTAFNISISLVEITQPLMAMSHIHLCSSLRSTGRMKYISKILFYLELQLQYCSVIISGLILFVRPPHVYHLID